jgi:hypothetical protein
VIAIPAIVALTVFTPAPVALSVPVATPLVFVDALGCVRLFPVPVAESTTVALGIGLPPASLAVTVMVATLAPVLAVSGVVGEATTVDWVALTVPVMPVAVKVTGLPVRPVAVAVSVLLPAPVPRVQLPIAAMPLALVVAGFVPPRLPPPEATANVTLVPDTGLLNASRTMTDGGVATAVPTVAL